MADDIEVKIDPALDLDSKEDEVVVKTNAEDGKKTDPAVEDLKKQHDEMAAKSARDAEARTAAERRARDAEAAAVAARAEATTARTQVVESNLDTINTALESAKSEMDTAERDIQAAGEAGDYTALAKAQRRMSVAAAKVQRYDEAKDDLETRKKTAIEAPKRREVSSDPVEAYVDGRTEPTANWLRSHRDYVTDPKKNARLTAAHWDAVSNDLTPDTDEYFTHVEEFIGLHKKNEDSTPAKNNIRKLTTRPVAPGANGAGGTGSSSGTEVRLSQREATAATDGTHVWNYDDQSGQKRFKKGDPIGVQEFARRKLQMTKDGSYEKVYAEQ